MNHITTRDGTRLFVKSLGEGRPVVLIHGWMLSADSWDPQMMALAEAGYQAIAYDRRGFGRSDQPAGGYDYDTFADDLADVMQASGATDDVALVGFSMGGGEVARYMARHGGVGVSQIALVSSVLPFLSQTDDNPRGVPAAVFGELEAGMRKDFRQFFRDFFKAGFGISEDGSVAPVSAAQLDWAWLTAMQAGQHAAIAAAKAFATTDFRADIAPVRVPTLIIHGTGDVTVPINISSRITAATIPGARLIEYEGAPHMVFATHQDRLTQDLLAFLGENGA